MKKTLLIAGLVLFLALNASAQFSFYLIDNFEDGNISSGPSWWHFGALKAEVDKNPVVPKRDLIAESCGDYGLLLSGRTKDWYVGGVGTDLGVAADIYSRFQIDLYGNFAKPGKLRIELFDDDNNNYNIEQDPKNDFEPLFDDRFVADVDISGPGFTRVSLPFSAFTDNNPGVGDDVWNPDQINGSGGLVKLQLVALGKEKTSEIDFRLDNILLTY